MNKPDVDFILEFHPVAIEQRQAQEIPLNCRAHRDLRLPPLLYARIGKTICFECGKVVLKDTIATVSEWLEEQNDEEKFYLGFPIHSHEGRTVKEELDLLRKKGFFRIFIKDKLIDLNETKTVPKTKKEIYVVLDRFKIKIGKVRETFAESIETAFKEGEGRLTIINADTNSLKQFTKFFECCGIRYEEPEPRFSRSIIRLALALFVKDLAKRWVMRWI